MKNTVENIDAILGRIFNIGTLIGAISLIVMVVMITINVFVRNMMGWAFLFVEEYSGYSLVLITYFGLALAFTAGKHIKMDMVITHIKNRRLKECFDVFTTLTCLGVVIYLIVKMTNYTLSSFEYHTRADWYSESILWPFHCIIPIGLTMFAAAIIWHLYKTVANMKREGNTLGSTPK